MISCDPDQVRRGRRSYAPHRWPAGQPRACEPSISRPRRSNPRVDAAIGGIAGLASGLLGVGGGFLLVPLQVMWSGTDQRRSSGTSLAAILPIALVGSVIYYFGKVEPQVDLTVAFFLVLGSAVGAFVGAHASRTVPENALKILVAVLLVVVGLKELHDAVFGGSAIAGSETGAFGLGHYLLITASGLVIGVLSGLTGVGGGVFIVPTLVLVFGLAQRVAQGTSLLAILPTAAVGAITHYRHGNVDVHAAGWIAVAGVPAALVGAALALWLPVRILAGSFGLFLIFAAIRTWPRRKRLALVQGGPDQSIEAKK
ncbi:MAG: sulfite exporter TauE/SafE family protein [Candidatus Dormibacterales bacterium]